MAKINNPKLFNAAKKKCSKLIKNINLNDAKNKVEKGSAVMRYTRPTTNFSDLVKVYEIPQNNVNNRFNYDQNVGIYTSINRMGQINMENYFAEWLKYNNPDDSNQNQEKKIVSVYYNPLTNSWNSVDASYTNTGGIIIAEKDMEILDLGYGSGLFNYTWDELKKDPEIIDLLQEESKYTAYFGSNSDITAAMGNSFREYVDQNNIDIRGIKTSSAGEGPNGLENLFFYGESGKLIKDLKVVDTYTILGGKLPKNVPPIVRNYANLEYNSSVASEMQKNIEFPQNITPNQRDKVVQEIQDKVKQLGKSIQLNNNDIINNALDAEINKELEKMDNPFSSNSIDELIDKLGGVNLENAVHHELSTLSKLLLSENENYRSLQKEIGNENIDFAVENQIVKPSLEKFVSDKNGISYVDLYLKTKLLNKKQDFLAQHASEIQEKELNIKQALSNLENSINEQNDKLNQINEELKNNPKNTDLKHDRDSLLEELQSKKAEMQEKQNENEKLTEEKSQNESDSQENSNEYDSAYSNLKERSANLFDS